MHLRNEKYTVVIKFQGEIVENVGDNIEMDLRKIGSKVWTGFRI
jgi:hypothetical protein